MAFVSASGYPRGEEWAAAVGEGQLAQRLLQVGDGGCRGSACLGAGKVRDREPNSSPHSCYSWECAGFMASGSSECTEQPCMACAESNVPTHMRS